MSDAKIDVQLEELRGRIKGIEVAQEGRIDAVETAQENHEKICALRYNQILTGQSEIKSDVSVMKTSILRYLGILFVILASFSTWALSTFWTAQQDTNRALIQMATGAKGSTTSLPYLPRAVDSKDH